jgi:hypothetical protein
MVETDETEAMLRALLKREGLTVPEDEITRMTAMYKQTLANSDRLYFDEVKYESPALIYAAQPR